MALLMLIIMGETIFNAIGITTPEFVKSMQESKWTYGIAIFFLGNNFQAGLL
jgi:hypothetical protein